MAAPDPIVVERQMYLDLLGITDDPMYTLAELRDMTGGGANAHRAIKSIDASGTVKVINTVAAKRQTLSSLKSAMDAGLTCGLQVLSDSTANDTFDWVDILGTSLAAKYPNYTVKRRLWSDANQNYGAFGTFQVGPAGDQYLELTPGALNGLTAPGANPVGDILDIRVKVTLTDWTPAVAQSIAARSGGAGFHSWWFNVRADAGLSFVHSSDGTALFTDNSNALLPVVDGDTKWIRVVFNPNNGVNRVIKFYYSDDGVTWTQLGTDITAAVSALFKPSLTGGSVGGRIEFGGRGTIGLSGKLWEVQIRDGDNGPTFAPCLPGLWESHPLSGVDASVIGSPTLAIINGSHPGASLSYHSDATRLPKLTPNYGAVALITSISHNEGTSTGIPFITLYDSWLTSLFNRLKIKPTVLTQNPETASAANSIFHARRRIDLLNYSDSVIDTFEEFTKRDNWQNTYMADSVHPNAAGQILIRDKILSAIGL